MSDASGTRFELWTRRPGGQWHSQRDGSKDALHMAAKRIVDETLHHVEVLIAPLGYMPVRQDQGQYKSGPHLPVSSLESTSTSAD